LHFSDPGQIIEGFGSAKLLNLVTNNGGRQMGDVAKLLVRRFIETVVNTGDLNRVAEFVAPAIAEETKRHVAGVRSTYSNLRVTVGDQIAEGEMVVTRVMARGTHTGPYLGLRPTNKTVVIEGVNVDRVRDGKIVEHWGAANTLEALALVGAFPLPHNS
jgi:predicted ester cyclase